MQAFVATAIITMLFSMVLFVQNVKADQTSIIALADSYVKSDESNANEGSLSDLYTYKREYELPNEHVHSIIYDTWLKFNLSEIPSEATVYSITLRLHTSLSSSNTTNRVSVFICSNNSWTELGITWNNAPPVSKTQPLQTIDVTTPNEYYDLDLTSALKGKPIVSLVLETIEPTEPLQWAIFDSKEGSYAPTLIAEYAVQPRAGPVDPFLTAFIVIIIIAAIILSAALALLRFKAIRKKGIQKTTKDTTSTCITIKAGVNTQHIFKTQSIMTS